MPKLSPIQKTIICQIAREAFDLWAGRPEFEQRYPDANTFDAWRHGEQQKAVGYRSLAHCDENLFPALKVHFQDLRARHEAAAKRAANEAAIGQQVLF